MVHSQAEQTRLRKVHTDLITEGALERWSMGNLGNQMMLHERCEVRKELLIKHGYWPLNRFDILDIGCGQGGELSRLLALGADPARLHGIDMLQEQIEKARHSMAGLDLRVADARNFSLGHTCVDLICLNTVFSSIKDDGIIFQIVERIREMLRASGAVLWYDFFLKSPNNPASRPIRRTDIERFFVGFKVELSHVTLLPPIARRLGPSMGWVYPILSKINFLCSHYCGILRPLSTES